MGLARAEWLAVGDAQGEAKGARITDADDDLPGRLFSLWTPDRLGEYVLVDYVRNKRRAAS